VDRGAPVAFRDLGKDPLEEARWGLRENLPERSHLEDHCSVSGELG
jgi:hypothetical protein